MTMTFLSNRKYSILRFIACSIGLIIHIYHVSKFYFSYISKTNIETKMPMKITIPSLSTCWLIWTIFNVSKLESNMNRVFYQWHEPGFSWIDSEYGSINDLTVSDVFDYAPDIGSIIDPNFPGCSLRISGEFVVKHLEASKCYRISHIEKYIQKHYMCYKISSIGPNSTLEAYEYAVSPSFVGIIFKINLDPNIFKYSDVFSAYVHNNKSSNYYDSLFASEHYRPPINKELWNDKYVNTRVSYQEVIIKRLKPPYDTHCEDYYNFSSNTEYKLYLLNNLTSDKLDRVTTFMQLKELSYYVVVSPLNYRNATFMKEFTKLINREKNSFGNPTCDFMLLISSSKYYEGKLLSIGVFWPRDPGIEISYQPE